MSQSLFTSQTPAVEATDGTAPGITTATTLSFDAAGTVSGIRFWCPSFGGPSDFTGELWQVIGNDDGAPNGTLLASASPTSVTPGGWTNIPFVTPVSVSTGIAYRAAVNSHNATARYYVATGNFFTAPLVNGHITGLQSTASPFPFLKNGVFADGVSAGTYPSNWFNSGNYFVDVLYDPAGAPTTVDLAAAFTATGSMTAALSNTVPLAAGLTATGSMTAALTREVRAAAALTATSGLTAGLANEVRLSAPLTATGTLGAALGPTEVRLSAALSATAGMSAALTVPSPTGPVDPIGMPVAQELLACFTEQLQTLPSPPKYIQLRVGQDTGPLIGANVDECCAGLAWVRISDIFPSWDSFPSADNTWTPCGPLAYAVTLEMGIAFCMPWSTTDDTFDDIDPPSTADWATAAATQMIHQTLMRRTAACCFRPTQRRAVGAWSSLPLEGGCTGGKLTVVVSVPAPCSDC